LAAPRLADLYASAHPTLRPVTFIDADPGQSYRCVDQSVNTYVLDAFKSEN